MNIDWERLARATAHPIQVSILDLLTIDGGRSLSPNEMSKELRALHPNVAYHAGVVLRAGVIELAYTRPVRGMTEHFYRLPKGTQ